MNTVINTTLLATGAPSVGIAGVGGAAVTPSAPVGTDAARFQTLMAAADPATNTAAPVATLPTATSHSTFPAPAHSRNPLVDDITQALRDVSNDVNGTFQRYQHGVRSGEPMSVAQMMQAHGELMTGLVKWDLTNKVIQKTTQSVDTIVKTQ